MSLGLLIFGFGYCLMMVPFWLYPSVFDRGIWVTPGG